MNDSEDQVTQIITMLEDDKARFRARLQTIVDWVANTALMVGSVAALIIFCWWAVR